MKIESKKRKGKRWWLRILSLISFTVLLLFFLIIFTSDKKEIIQEPATAKERTGVAVIITGAAARIPQEGALLKELDSRGLLKDLVFISGVSSGALNAIMLNGILSGKITWGDYYELLDSLDNNHIFIRDGKRLPVSTAPARALYKSVFEDKLGYHSIGDLPITTSLSFTHLEDLKLRKTEYRMCSRKINAESDTTLSLVDIAMASSAFPVVFPPARISNAKTIPDVEFVDGGLGDDHVPWRALLQFEQFRGIGLERVYIISRESDDVPAISEELKGFGINDKGIFDRLGFSLDAILTRGIMRGIESYATEAPELVPLSYVWMPVLDTNFLFFSFDALGEQYTRTLAWADTNEPVRLADFLLPYLLKGK